MGNEQFFVIGINGGATHTGLALLNDRLDVLARAEVGSSNFRNVGFGAAISTLEQGVIEITKKAHLPLPAVAGIGIGVAGVDHVNERRQVQEAMEIVFPGKKILVDNDAVPALVGGAGQHFGIVVISGTGSIVIGIDAQGQRARTGGWGYHLDQGSGFAIARETLAAITRAQDTLGPSTALTERILARLKLKDLRELVDWLYVPGRRIDEIAALAAETVALAETEQDLTAVGIIAQAADALAGQVIAALRQLDFGDTPFPLVMSGSIFHYSGLLRDLFTSTVMAFAPNAVIVQAMHDAAVGAAMMALTELGVHLPPPELPAPTLPVRRPSEQRHRLTMHISQQPALDLATIMNLEDRRIPQAIAPELPHIAALIEAIAERFAQGGRLFMVGAGTSGRLAVLDAAECAPTFSATPDEVAGILAGGPAAMVNSVEGAEDDEAAGRAAIAERNVGPLDSVIGVAASGSTPFVQGALREASERGALTGSISNAPRAPISALAQYPITVVIGPEVITGSTRLKAGTAQKMILNMISTGVMVQVGRTFNNLMTDMQASNVKLRERAVIIVTDATGLSRDEARALLQQCDGEMKTAITCALTGSPPDEARQRLAAVGGNLNRLKAVDESNQD
jgi:N-acetylmuramic acid 6-phosphate etherase